MRDNRRGYFRRESRREQFFAERREIISGHINDERRFIASNFFPICRCVRSAFCGAMTAHDDHAGAFAPVRERDAQRRRSCRSCRDPGHNLKRNTCRLERVDLFTEPAKNGGISAVEANDPQTVARRFYQSFVDLRLGYAFAATALAYVDDLAVRARDGEDRAWHEVIMEHQIRFADQASRLHGQKVWVARPCPDQAHSCRILRHDSVFIQLTRAAQSGQASGPGFARLARLRSYIEDARLKSAQSQRLKRILVWSAYRRLASVR
jgi:hypothetical protein